MKGYRLPTIQHLAGLVSGSTLVQQRLEMIFRYVYFASYDILYVKILFRATFRMFY